jgi:hypothetical protein
MRITHPGVFVFMLAGLVEAAASCSGDTAELAPASFSVKLVIEGNGAVVSEPATIDCTGPSDCGTTKVLGAAIKLVARPTAGNVLLGWSVDGIDAGASTSIALQASANETRVVRAVFGDPGSRADAGIADARPDDGSTTGDAGRDAPAMSGSDPYFAVCYSSIMAGNLSRALRFLAESSDRTPDGGRFLGMTLNPLRSTARTVSRAETVGAPLVFPEVSVGPGGAFSHSITSAVLDGEANPLSGRDVTFQPFSQRGVLASAEFCTSFTSTIVQPIMLDVNGTCLYFRVPVGTPFAIAADGSSISIPSLAKTLTVPNFSCGI